MSTQEYEKETLSAFNSLDQQYPSSAETTCLERLLLESVQFNFFKGEDEGFKWDLTVCRRCNTHFEPNTYYDTPIEKLEPCDHHYGRLRGGYIKRYDCCNRGDLHPTCSTAPRHVYERHTKPYPTLDTSKWLRTRTQHGILALDGEMCYTKDGLDLCRLSIVDWDENCILDILIQPDSPIIDYNTRFSGITASQYEEGGFDFIVPRGVEARVCSLEELRTRILPRLIGPHTILIGHSPENDLFHIGIDHKRVLDTSNMFISGLERPYRRRLKDLCSEYLHETIQDSMNGHDSFEDSVACLRLVKYKMSLTENQSEKC